ncbi:turripeptide Gsp9.3-like [Stomoxys calcitrans]|uniref:turripeptide Gsp9.3-like n=1 Tax=Stomoxys calcitrans TaxID=35570 RepID=UPI0027E21EB2|nr:turripeptide Gsp9.3-like [Stomoxys calcitrans]
MASFKLIFTLAFIAIMALANLPSMAEAQRRKCPDVCTFIYSPVCATLNNGSRRQFSNSCTLDVAVCKENLRVKSSRPGKC